VKDPFFSLIIFQIKSLLLRLQDNTGFGCISFMRRERSSLFHCLGKLGKSLLRGISKIDEFSTQLDQYNLKYAEEIKGFDPNNLFTDHMTYVGFSKSLTNTFVFGEEEGDSHDPLTQIVEKRMDDIETIVSMTDQYKQRGRVSTEKSAQSPIVSQKTAYPSRFFSQ
jgi:hypothetical protein